MSKLFFFRFSFLVFVVLLMLMLVLVLDMGDVSLSSVSLFGVHAM